jgi:hypothetical protein
MNQSGDHDLNTVLQLLKTGVNMKLNEIATGKRVWVLVMLEEGGHKLDNVHIEGVFSSDKEAYRTIAQIWYDGVIDDLEDEKQASALTALLKSTSFSFDKFSKIAENVDYSMGPTWDEMTNYYAVVASTLK